MSCSDYPTANDAKRFKKNADTFDAVVTSSSDSVVDQDGRTILTLTGAMKSIESDAEEVSNAKDAALTQISDDVDAAGEFVESPDDTFVTPEGEQKLTVTGVLNQTQSLAEAQRENIEATFTAQFAYKRIGNISLYVGDSLPEVDKLNSYQYPDDSGEWYGPVQSQVFPITIPADPSSDNGWALVNALTSSTDLEGSNVTATGSTTPRTLGDRFADVVNVKDFGAVGDGITDDTNAIQAALNLGGNIYVPQGTFICNGARGKLDTRISGIGTLQSTNGRNVVNFVGCNVIIDGINFSDDETFVFGTKLVTTLNCPYVTIQNCFAVDVWNGFFEAVLEDTFTGERHIRFLNNRIDNTSQQAANTDSLEIGAASFIGGYSGEFKGNYITNIPGNGARMFPFDDTIDSEEQRPSNWVISENTIYRCKRPSDGEGQCIYYRGHYMRMHDNYFYLTGRNLVDIQGPLSQTQPARGILVHDNIFLNRDNFMTNTAAALLHLRCCEAIVSNNVFYGGGTNNAFQHDGILAKWGGTLTASGNTFPLKTINGFEHVIRGNLIQVSTSDTVNDIGFDDVTISNNSGWARFFASNLIAVASNSTQLINSVTVTGNTVSGAGRLLGMSDTNTDRIRIVSVGSNNISDSAEGIIDVDQVGIPFSFRPIDYGRMFGGLPTAAPDGSTVYDQSSNRPAWFDAGASAWKFSDGTEA